MGGWDGMEMDQNGDGGERERLASLDSCSLALLVWLGVTGSRLGVPWSVVSFLSRGAGVRSEGEKVQYIPHMPSSRASQSIHTERETAETTARTACSTGANPYPAYPHGSPLPTSGFKCYHPLRIAGSET